MSFEIYVNRGVSWPDMAKLHSTKSISLPTLPPLPVPHLTVIRLTVLDRRTDGGLDVSFCL